MSVAFVLPPTPPYTSSLYTVLLNRLDDRALRRHVRCIPPRYKGGDLQIIYADGRGNIKSAQRVSGSWSNPAIIATDAATGTTVSVSIIYYHDTGDDDMDASCVDYVDV